MMAQPCIKKIHAPTVFFMLVFIPFNSMAATSSESLKHIIGSSVRAESTAAKKTLRVLISSDKEIYRTSDSVKLTVLIRNDSGREYWIYHTLAWGEAASLSLWVKDAETRSFVKQVYVLDAMTPPPESNASFAEIPNHYYYGVECNFSLKQMNIRKSGRYTINVNYHSPIPRKFGGGLQIWSKEMGETVSNQIVILVK